MRRQPSLALAALSVLAALLATPPAAAGDLPVVDSDPATTERIADASPVDFAIAVSGARFDDGAAEAVTISRDDAFADSLAGAPLTGAGPLLFTRTGELPAGTAAELQRVLPDDGTVYLLGGVAAVSEAVEAEIAGLGYDVVRLAGPSRLETAIVIATEVRERFGDTGSVAVARGFGPEDNPTAAWADSVAAGAWAARGGHPVVISPTEDLPGSVGEWLDEDAPEETVVLGGEAALSAAVADAVPNPRRVAGADRAATAAAIATDLLGVRGRVASAPIVAFNPFEPLGWTRGLAAAGLAAALDAPLLALNQAGIPPATAALVAADGDDPQVEVVVAGPATEVSAQLVAEMDELDAGPPAPERLDPGVPVLVSVSEDGQPGDDRSTSPDLGGDGSLVAFTSNANNLGETDGDRQRDPIVRDLVAGTTTEVSGSPSPFIIGATSAQAVSGDNRYVASVGFGIDQNAIHVWDTVTAEMAHTTRVDDVEPGQGRRPNVAVISDDGEWVAFELDGSVYRQRRDGSDRQEVFAGRNGQGFADTIYSLFISADGSRVAFRTTREDLEGGSFDPQVFTVDVAGGGPPVLVSKGIDGQPAEEQVQDIAMSADGSTIAFSTRATNITADEVSGNRAHLYVHEVATGANRLVDRHPDGSPATQGVETAINGFGISLTDDGREVVVATEDGVLVGAEFSRTTSSIVSFDLVAGSSRPEFVPPENTGSSRFPTISGDGRRIAFNRSQPSADDEQVWLVVRAP